ncbi:hypothetical protein RIF23_07600 [Lipingzhangella sp. LS1_29]|uniref:Secreted protein n=1 Tax=Lipingzhangella rawalii TaxID=2055835 RepID=A0ABU2H4E1_9ACTN|nr:hypothetical protein [Lipingzhangella rawalii]MDS1270156.1 hypothetical protein [Lipingzhangella rawalii]
MFMRRGLGRRWGCGLAVGLVAATVACGDADNNGDGNGEDQPQLSGLALVYRGYDGGDPEEDQALVFTDPDTGAQRAVLELPDGVLDPMVADVAVHLRFSEDWRLLAYSPPGGDTVHVAQLDADDSAYEVAVSLRPDQGATYQDPRIHDERIWFTAHQPPAESVPGRQGAGTTRVMSVPLDDPESTPREEAVLGETGPEPQEWQLTPDGTVHVREQVQVEQIPDVDGQLSVRRSGGHVMNASYAEGGQQWSSRSIDPVWGGDTTILTPERESADQGGAPEQPQAEADSSEEPGDQPGAARMVTLSESTDPDNTDTNDTGGEEETAQDGAGGEETQEPTAAAAPESADITELLPADAGPMVQYVPAPDRDALLVQSPTAWYRVEVTDGTPQEPEELFEAPADASLAGSPVAAGWKHG